MVDSEQLAASRGAVCERVNVEDSHGARLWIGVGPIQASRVSRFDSLRGPPAPRITGTEFVEPRRTRACHCSNLRWTGGEFMALLTRTRGAASSSAIAASR